MAIACLEMPQIGLGCLTFGGQTDEAEAFQILDLAYEFGITFFDTALTYNNERAEIILGKWLRMKSRDNVFIATKVFGRTTNTQNKAGLSREHIQTCAELSRKNLGVDYIDLYQLHFPDPKTDPEESIDAVESLVDRGLVRQVGCCNFSPAEVIKYSRKGGWRGFQSIQIRHNLLYQADLSAWSSSDITGTLALIAYNPLGGGMLTGKYSSLSRLPTNSRLSLRDLYRERYLTSENLKKVRRLQQIAMGYDVNIVTLALAWLLAHQNLHRILLGTSNVNQVKANLKSLECAQRLATKEGSQLLTDL